jgi:hypothetical protein
MRLKSFGVISSKDQRVQTVIPATPPNLNILLLTANVTTYHVAFPYCLIACNLTTEVHCSTVKCHPLLQKGK